jgi:hypothetical protein
MYRKSVLFAIALGFCLVPAVQALNIIWISESIDINSDGNPDDYQWVPWLQGLGYNLDVQRGNWSTLDAAKIAALNAADLIIFSRTTTSANFCTDSTEITQWNSITKPILLTHAYIARNSRNLWVNSATINNLVGPMMQVQVSSHPIFTGIKLDANGQVSVVDGTTGSGQTSFIGTLDVGSGKVLASTATGTNAWIVEWQPGSAFYAGAGTPAAKRMLFSAGTQEVSPTPQGAFNLTEDGKKMFNNAIRYMAGLSLDLGGPTNPSPADKATDVIRDAVLGWKAGEFARTHDVYFGTSLDAVSNASRTAASGVLVSQGQDANAYDPAGLLAFGQTYYWRTDEVNAPPTDSKIFKGPVWSFTSEPFAYPISGTIKATASSSLTAAMGPEKTINGSGLSATGEHSTASSDMWLSKKGTTPIWIQYEFDKSYKLSQMWVWNSNQAVEPTVGFGAKDVKVETSVDGTNWTALANAPEFSQATGEPNYVHNTTVDFGGLPAKFVKLTINTNWADSTKQAGLSEVRFFYVPVKAFGPAPADAGTGVAINGVLNWRSGREAVKHNVTIGSDATAVASGAVVSKTVTDHSFSLASLGLEYGRTYYWKVDEVNDAAATQVWAGDVWSFTTTTYGVVDDFESYNDLCNRVFFGWIDGFGYSAFADCGVSANLGNATGSTVGNINAPFAEQTIVHSGRQSMPMSYNNAQSPFYSETQHEWQTAQSWTGGGANTLTVWVRGDAPAFLETSPGTIVMNGMGTDIWNNADEGRFVWKTLKGNGSILAKVEAVANTNAWAKAGVMIRGSLDAGSTYAFACVSASSGVAFQHRDTAAGAAAGDTVTPVLTAPYWVKVTRNGTAFTAQRSVDSVTWVDITPATAFTITMSNDVYIGLAVTSHQTGSVCGAKFSSVGTTGNVTGAWQSADVGTAQSTSGNNPEAFYVAVQDSAGKSNVVTCPDLALISTGNWAQWDIALSQFSSAGINLGSVKKMMLGVGDRSSPKAGGTGKLYIDDIRLTRVAP